MLRSVIIAFSMYSRIPMPKVDWNEKNMRYSLCFFPLVGAVTGLCQLGCYYGLNALSVSRTATAVLMTVLPILISGGIHMDGFLDTIDAKSSYKPVEEKLKILKDPHTGAFAVIYAMVYLLATFGLYYEITETGLWVMAVGYVCERVFSGYSVIALKKAKKEGTAAAFADAAKDKQKWIKNMIFPLEFIICIVLFGIINPVYGGVCIVAALLAYWHYCHMSAQQFGGVTGDMAGYFLQVCEIMMLVGAVVTGKLFPG